MVLIKKDVCLYVLKLVHSVQHHSHVKTDVLEDLHEEEGTMALRPPCEEPSSPLHPGSQDFVILAFAWVVTSCLIGDGQSPPVIFW